MVAKCRSWNHAALSLSIEMNMTDTPSPTSRRPADAVTSVSAMPNNSEPMPASTPPIVTTRRGPQVSARMPVGICITVYT